MKAQNTHTKTHIQGNPANLEYLNLYANDEIEDIAPLTNLINLKHLNVRYVPVNDNVWIFKNMTKLHDLNVRNCGIRDTYVFDKLISEGALQGEAAPVHLFDYPDY